MKIRILLTESVYLNEACSVDIEWPYSFLPRIGESFRPGLLENLINWDSINSEVLISNFRPEYAFWGDLYGLCKSKNQPHREAMKRMMTEYFRNMMNVGDIVWDVDEDGVIPEIRLSQHSPLDIMRFTIQDVWEKLDKITTKEN